ncbi:MAG: BtpA/SgcQ family protein [Phycisphaerae bacterium]
MIDLPSPALIGVVHLPALPGAPCHQLPMDEIIERTLADALILRDAGFDAIIVENFGDLPFSGSRLSPGSVAALALVADRARRATSLPLGINALRNDARSALGIAAAAGGSFIRVNVHTGVSATDQGMIEGRAAQTLRYRRQLGARIAILADVHVKHAEPVSQPDLASAARETAYRGLADGLIVTGRATGEPVNPDHLTCVRAAVPDRRVYVGSGATAESARCLMESSSGIIVGTALKPGGDASVPIDASLARAFARAARRG